MTAAMPADPTAAPLPRTLDACQRELVAARLALAMVGGVLRAESFTWSHRPIAPDVEGRVEWVRTALAPLSASSPTVRHLLVALDLDGAGRKRPS